MEHPHQISQTLAVLLREYPGVILADMEQVGRAINATTEACYIRSHNEINFPPVTPVGSRIFVKITDLADWIDSRPQRQSRIKEQLSISTDLALKQRKRGRPTKADAIAKRLAVAESQGVTNEC